jgi:hypothetical protein
MDSLDLKLKSLPADLLIYITGFLPITFLPRTAVTQKADERYRPTTVTITDDEKKCEETRYKKRLHSRGDEPAVVTQTKKEWYKEGRLHRDGDLPAVVMADGTQMWYKRGMPHRDGDLPAKILADGTQMWFIKGKSHRADIG